MELAFFPTVGTSTMQEGSPADARSVAVVVVHGVGSPSLGDTARAAAQNLMSVAGASSAREQTVHLRDASGRAFTTPHVVCSVRENLNVDLFELHWADLSRNKPHVISIVAQLVRVVPCLMLLAQQGLRKAGEGKAPALDARLFDLLVWLLTRVLPGLNAAVVLGVVAGYTLLLPASLQSVVGLVLLIVGVFSLSTWLLYLRARQRFPASPFALTVAVTVVALAGGAWATAATGWNTWSTDLPFFEVLLIGLLALAIGTIRATTLLGRAGSSAALLLGMLAFVRVATWGTAGPALSTPLGGLMRILFQGLAWTWAVTVVTSAFLWLMGIRRNDRRASQSLRTARVALGLSFCGGVLLQTLVAALTRRLDCALPGDLSPSPGFEGFVFDSLKLAWPVVTLVALAGLILACAWALGPSAVAEFVSDPASNEAADSERMGQWLTSGRSVIGTVLEHLSGLLLFGALGLYLLAMIYNDGWLRGWLEEVDFTFWTLALPACTAALVGVLRSPAGLKRIWPILGVVLDIDTYMRASMTARARILDRGSSLLRAIDAGKLGTGGCYSAIIVLAHSQGTLIAADLLRELARSSTATHASIRLFTMGSPIRALYAALLPGELGWFLDAAEQAQDDGLGVAHWRNLYFSGDYIGRSLWRPEQQPSTFSASYESISLRRSEHCLGPGGHMQYWHSPAVGREVLAQIMSCHAVQPTGE